MSNKSIQFIFFLLISFGVIAFFSLCYNKNLCLEYSSNNMNNFIDQPTFSEPSLSFPFYKIAFISDTHENSSIFPSLKDSLQANDPNILFHIGDLTNFGTTESLSKAKDDLDSLKMKYFALPGDHDIAQTSSTLNFDLLFSQPESFLFEDINVLVIPNFYNFTPISETKLKSLISNIPNFNVFISPQPIYVDEDNIFYNKYMGSDTAFENLTPTQIKNLKVYNQQRLLILEEIRKSKTSKIVISGDHHRSSNFLDPVNSKIQYHIVGSLAKYIDFGNTKLLQTSLQSNRYSILEFYRDQNESISFRVKEIELKN